MSHRWKWRKICHGQAQGLKRAAVYDSGMHNVYYAQRLTIKNIKTVIVKIKKISPFVNDFARLFILPTRILKYFLEVLEQYIFLTIFIYYFLKIEKAICGTENYKIALLTLRPWFCFKWRIKKPQC